MAASYRAPAHLRGLNLASTRLSAAVLIGFGVSDGAFIQWRLFQNHIIL